MPAKKGTMPPNAGKGRPKGSKNFATKQLTEMVEKAMVLAGKKLQKDDLARAAASAKKDKEPYVPMLVGMDAGEAYLMTMALSEPKSFMSLVSKLMPTKVEGNINIFTGQELVEKLQAGRALAMRRSMEIEHDEHGVQ